MPANQSSHDLPQDESIWRVYRFFTKYLRKHAGRLTLAFTALAGAVLMNLVRPWPLKLVFDYVLLADYTGLTPPWPLQSADPGITLLASCAAIVLVALLFGIFDYVQMVSAATVGAEDYLFAAFQAVSARPESVVELSHPHALRRPA